ncbi:MAG TPA: SIS domain-containing protein [Vicinamibacterales bacterium]|nr:SIS domain-containing protein [Vicinamibacterales bacterium]
MAAGIDVDRRTYVRERFGSRNAASRALFDREAERLAHACEAMSSRFLRGGRLLAFGRGAAATDAQHVSVEFVHPVIVGKRALPALDLSAAFESWLPAIVRDVDIAMAFSSPAGDPGVDAALDAAAAAGALTLALPGRHGDFAIDAPSPDPLVSQELVEVLYHTLWETVHVFFEHGATNGDRHPALQTSADELGASAFLYPFLGGPSATPDVVGGVAASIRAKAAEDERLREEVAREQGEQIVAAARAIRERILGGATLLMFGNGGSATDANDWALDCVGPMGALPAVRAISLSMEPANITAIANDVGQEVIFLRQLIAHGRRGDVAIAISTSGGSANVIAALEEARRRGMLTVALLGYDGGEIARRGLADFPIVVRCDYIPRIQEVQASIYHVMTEILRQPGGTL